MWVLGIEPRAWYIQGKNFANQAIIPDTSLKKKRMIRDLEEERRSDYLLPNPCLSCLTVTDLTLIS